MKQGDLLFVYGTLRRGESADLSINSGAESLGEDKINGMLYDLGWYPGVKLLDDAKETGAFTSELPTVSGDVFRLLNASIIPHLDAYEGYPNLYTRAVVTTHGGLDVWVYVYNYDVNPASQITNGDWLRPVNKIGG